MGLYFITGNNNKLLEVQEIIPEIKQLEFDLPEIQSFSAKEIIETKLQEASKKYPDLDLIVEDTSLYLDCLGGFPGPFIKFFLERNSLDGIYSIAKDRNNYGVFAKTMIGYKRAEEKDVHFFEGIVYGTVVKPTGPTKFGWDPIFKPDGYTKSFEEMGKEKKNEISMRKIATEKLKEFLKK